MTGVKDRSRLPVGQENHLTREAGQSQQLPKTMKRKPLPVLWISTAFAVALGLAAAVLILRGIDTKSLVLALRLTARWSFLLFWLAYAGGATAALFGPTFAPLVGRGREFGLAYASAMTVHFCLVLWLFQISSRPPLAGAIFDFFVIGIVFTYLLAVFSFGRLVEALGPIAWSILRVVGMNYILFAFAWDFVLPVFRADTKQNGIRGLLVEYVPFAVMCVAAPLLVFAAAAHRRLQAAYGRLGIEPVVDEGGKIKVDSLRQVDSTLG